MKIIKKNTKVVIKYFIGETVVPLVKRLDDGSYQFRCDAYVIGETCKDGFVHLHHARKLIPGKKLGHNVKFWPRLRKALHICGLEPIYSPGGYAPIHYIDEVVIPDFTMSDVYSAYYVIKKANIGKYLDKLPLDDAGKARAEEFARKKAEAYPKAHDHKSISKRIGEKLWFSGGMNLSGEFKKITLVADNNSEFSVMYPELQTNLLWSDHCYEAQVVCTARETGITYLGPQAALIDPRKHCRIKKIYWDAWHGYTAYLMPDPNLATKVRESCGWLDIFYSFDNDGISPELIASAKKVILESYDLYDQLLPVRYVYDRQSKEVTQERTFNSNGEITGKPLWHK